ncbi:conserved membrane hypothetical protein [Flavobacterium sp. 9AF]|uniref:hypothetical protein n=1 Tax=Flavobacterium sp. 9AF TaxID=2653142 RepID=UPI0012F3F37D|nr:hypothetical protein [Flavobacterium sp. 9AF]VXB56897.1 conserved membrane hypothetical protein [Flavobacterium sp. 9AF]
MTKKQISLHLTILIVAFAYSFLCIPKKFETEGGSCYQGITTAIIRFFLIVCFFLNLLSIYLIYYKSKIETAKVLCILSLIIWTIGTFIHSYENIRIGIIYFTPFIIMNSLMLFLFKKQKSSVKTR